MVVDGTTPLFRAEAPRTRPVFVLGSQRSGTRLPLVVLERSPDIITYSEGSSRFFDRVLLKDDDIVTQRLRESRFPVVVLKPICESHRALQLLERFEAARAIWIFRSFQDTVNSVSARWRNGRDSLGHLASGNLEKAGWRAGGLTEEKFDLVRRHYRDDMSLHAANAMMWYLRNSLFFDLQLEKRRDVLLVQYEDLVLEPQKSFSRMFRFVGLPFKDEFVKGVYSSSVKAKPFPAIPSSIQSLCEQLHDQLVETYTSAVRAQ